MVPEVWLYSLIVWRGQVVNNSAESVVRMKSSLGVCRQQHHEHNPPLSLSLRADATYVDHIRYLQCVLN